MKRMLKFLFETANAVVLKAKAGRRLAAPGGDVKLNLGSSIDIADGWIHLDASSVLLLRSMPEFVLRKVYALSSYDGHYTWKQFIGALRQGVFVHHNVEFGIPYPDRCATYVYSSHFLEHLFHEDAVRVLREMHRVMKPGGVVRVCVPDLAHYINEYRRGNKQFTLEGFFMTSAAGYFGRHKWMYDYPLMARELRRAGFRKIRRCRYRQGAVPDLRILDNRPTLTLFVEATK